MSEPLIPAWRCRRAIVLFVGCVLLLLIADVVSKYLSFRFVAGQPIRLTTPDDQGQPVVEVQQSDGSWVQAPRRHPDHPASAVPPHQPRTIVPYVLDLTLTINTGAVFGIGQGRQVFFITMSLLATAAVLWFFVRSLAGEWWVHIGLGLLLSGAWGNLYDRMIYAGVRDMFHLFPGVHLPWGLSWPGGSTEIYPWIFNVADVSLLAGVALLLISSFLEGRRRPEPAKAAG